MNTPTPPGQPDEELVVLLDAEGRALGTAPKSGVHHAHTPLHLAFSAYLFDDRDRLLITRRALDKATFPGQWTNSVCGHPAPGESPEDAVRRRSRDELGVEVRTLRLALPRFAYRAEMGGIVEWEMCPVLFGRVEGVPAPDPTEVSATEWVPWSDFAAQILAGRRAVTLWCREQVKLLAELGTGPDSWPDADPAELPAAVRPQRSAGVPHPTPES